MTKLEAGFIGKYIASHGAKVRRKRPLERPEPEPLSAVAQEWKSLMLGSIEPKPFKLTKKRARDAAESAAMPERNLD